MSTGWTTADSDSANHPRSNPGQSTGSIVMFLLYVPAVGDIPLERVGTLPVVVDTLLAAAAAADTHPAAVDTRPVMVRNPLAAAVAGNLLVAVGVGKHPGVAGIRLVVGVGKPPGRGGSQLLVGGSPLLAEVDSRPVLRDTAAAAAVKGTHSACIQQHSLGTQRVLLREFAKLPTAHHVQLCCMQKSRQLLMQLPASYSSLLIPCTQVHGQ